MAKAKKVIKRVKKAKAASPPFVDVSQAALNAAMDAQGLNEVRFSMNEFNESMEQFSTQAADLLTQTHDDAVHDTHIKTFINIARHLPDNAAVVLMDTDTMRALKKELEQLGY